MALHAGHGEFPRFIFAPGTPEQAFFLTNKAFDLAEKYQVPAFVLFDTYLADTQWSYSGFDLTRIRTMDYRLRGEAFQRLPPYVRHALTEGGVTRLAVPGEARHLVCTDSDEHDEQGHITENAAVRTAMVEKRLFRKLPRMKREMMPPFLFGDHNADIVVASWGSLYGILREAVDELARSHSISMLHFAELYPLPGTESFDYLQLLRRSRLSVCVEQNATGQLARLLRAETGYEFDGLLTKYDGRPFTVESLVKNLKGMMKKL